MKIRFFIVFLVAISASLFCAGCAPSESDYHDSSRVEDPVSEIDPEENNMPESGENNVELIITVEPEYISLSSIPDFISIKVTNASEDTAYRGGCGYSIDYFDGSDWIKAVIPPVDDEMIVIEPQETLSFDHVQLQPDQYRYASGKYRVNFNGFFADFSIGI